MFGCESPAQMRVSPGEFNLTMRVPAVVLNDFVEQETGRPVTAPVVFEQQSDPRAADAPGLRRYLEFACNEIERRSRIAETGVVARQMERMITSLVMSQLPNNYSEAFGGEPLGGAPHYVRLVEDYVRSHADEPLTLRAMADIGEVSIRTLQSGFRRYRDTTPMEYLRDYRLDLARQSLEQSGAARTVTEVAQACGFNHPGKFSKCYRNRFGEAPSVTRRRAMT